MTAYRLIIPLLTFISFSALAKTITVEPREDPKAILHNPGMGWVLYENYPIDPDPHGSSTLLTLPNESFSDVDQVALMFSWADIESAPERYDFSKVDFAYNYWAKRGKAIQLRMSAETLLWWVNRQPPAGVGVPQYLLDQLPPDKKLIRHSDGIPYAVVDAREPVYLDRLGKFLDAVEKHFDRARPVTLIDLRGFGLWGEWHTGYPYPSTPARHDALCGVLDCWSTHLPDHVLALSYSHDPDSPKSYYAGPYKTLDEKFTDTYRDYLNYSAFDHALTLKNVTLRRDGVGGAVFSNQRKLNEAAFTAGKGSMVSEFLGGYGQCKKGGRAWIDWMIDDALSLHPNYINLLGWQGGDALNFTRERPDLIQKGLLTMGYRLLPEKIVFPDEAAAGRSITVKTDWINRGVGRAPRDFELHLALVGMNQSHFNLGHPTIPTNLMVKDQTRHVESSFEIPNLSPGEYELEMNVIDPESGQSVSLPLSDSHDAHYPIGSITIK